MTSVLLARLERVRQTGPGRWIASCPTSAHAHGDRHPSLGIRETEDGRVLLRCHAYGCAVEEIVGAVGLDLSDLFPPRPIEHAKGERRPFPAADVLRALADEMQLVAVAAANLAQRGELSDAERERLMLAAERISAGKALALGER